jgi:hypothetical protein
MMVNVSVIVIGAHLEAENIKSVIQLILFPPVTVEMRQLYLTQHLAAIYRNVLITVIIMVLALVQVVFAIAVGAGLIAKIYPVLTIADLMEFAITELAIAEQVLLVLVVNGLLNQNQLAKKIVLFIAQTVLAPFLSALVTKSLFH